MATEIKFDDRDATILAEREKKRGERFGPRVGDYIHMLDGTLRRFTHHWGDGLQTTYQWREENNRKMFGENACGGSFYLAKDGSISFSGSLDDAIPLTQIEETGETRTGPCWFFHHDEWGAGRGVYTSMVCRVYRQIA